MTEQKELMTILKAAIADKKNDVKEYNRRVDQNLSQKMQLLENLKKDVNEITKIDINQLNECIDLFSISDDEKLSLKKELDVIKALLTLNQTEKTNYTLFSNQLSAIATFLDNLEDYIEKKNQEKQDMDPEYNRIMLLTNQYKKLLSQLKKPNNVNLITDLSTILQLFQEENINEKEKQAILLSLIKYNQEVVAKKEKEIQAGVAGISDQELVVLFKKYGYSYDKLNKKYQDILRRKASRKNIEEVFSTMQQLSFSKIDETSKGLLLTTYLVASNKQIIKEVTGMARQRGINITTIESLVCAYIPRNSYYYEGLEIGRYEDFKKNLSLFAEHGISIPLVAEKIKELLVFSNQKLQKNMEWLEHYGLYSDTNEGALLDDFLSALMSQKIPELIDLWIESHFLGIQYIKNNLNILSSHLSYDSLLFYKLYLSQKDHTTSPFRLTMANGVKKLHLKKEFSKEDIPYQGIYDLNSAKRIIGYKEIHFDREEEYNQAAEESLVQSISDDIFDNKYIINLDHYLDTKESLLYDINGIKISKLKVLRIYNMLCKKGLGNTIDSILFSICYHKIMTVDEYDQLLIDIKKIIEV